MKKENWNQKTTSLSLGFNDILAFVLEIGALVLWGLWAWSVPRALPFKIALTVLCVGGFVALWALFFARNAGNRPGLIGLFIGKLLLLLPPGLLYFWKKPPLALLWAALVLVHLVIGVVQGKL